MNKKKIRIGMVGTLHDHSVGKLRSVHKLSDTFEVVGIAAEDAERSRQLQREYPYSEYPFLSEEDLLERGCDAVLVEGFEYELPFAAKRFIDRGIPVHIDKPAGRDQDVFEAALRSAKRQGIPVQMGYMYRYNPAVQTCMEMIRNGQLGDIRSVTAVMNTGHPRDKQRWLARFKGGIMFFLGCHMLDLIFRIQGMPLSITPYIMGEDIEGERAENQATAVLAYESGFSIAQANACEVNGYGRRQLVVCGTKGTLEIRPLERAPRVFFTGADAADPFEDRHTEMIFPEIDDAARYDAMMLDFARMVRGEIKNPYSYAYELQLQKIVLASCGYNVDYGTPAEL